jgi:hypothetical protein
MAEGTQVSQTVIAKVSQTKPELENRELSQTVVVELRSLRIGSVRTQVSEKEVTNCEVSQTNSSLLQKTAAFF